MFKRLRVKAEPPKPGLDLGEISISQLIGDVSLPVTIKALNSLPENPKLRLYRALIPIQVLAEFDINPRTWKNPDKLPQVRLDADHGSDKVKITAWYGADPQNEFCFIGSCRDTPHIWGCFSPKCAFCAKVWKNHGNSQRA